MKPAIFIQRDGVLIYPKMENGRVTSPRLLADLSIHVEAVTALRKLKEAGFLLLVVTHQPGLSRGYLSRYELERIHLFLAQIFPVDEFLVCPHDEMDDCPCCPPNPGLLIESTYTWQVDLPRSFVLSDKWQDAETARVAGCTSVLLRSPWNGRGHHDFIVADLKTATDKIIQLSKAGLAVEN